MLLARLYVRLVVDTRLFVERAFAAAHGWRYVHIGTAHAPRHYHRRRFCGVVRLGQAKEKCLVLLA